MTKTQQKKRLFEAKKKISAVYMAGWGIQNPIVSVSDVMAIEKILDKCLKRCQ
jgi:hypothetical protein